MSTDRPGAAPTDSRIHVRWDGADVLVVEFHGQVDAALTRDAIAAASKALHNRRAGYFIIDAAEASGYRADVRAPGVELLQLLKAGGATSGVAVTVSSAIRMIGAAVAFVASLRVEFVSSLGDARKRVEEHRRRAVS